MGRRGKAFGPCLRPPCAGRYHLRHFHGAQWRSSLNVNLPSPEPGCDCAAPCALPKANKRRKTDLAGRDLGVLARSISNSRHGRSRVTRRAHFGEFPALRERAKPSDNHRVTAAPFASGKHAFPRIATARSKLTTAASPEI